MNIKLWLGIITFVIIVGALFVMLGGGKNETSPPAPVPDQISNQLQNRPNKPIATSTIIVNTSGFKPASITVKAGTKVTWDNKSGGDISINSDDHPTHRLFKEINIGHIPNNLSNSVLFEKPGTFTYHDHYNPERTGKIIVE